jgi:hypothetical protein
VTALMMEQSGRNALDLPDGLIDQMNMPFNLDLSDYCSKMNVARE